MGEKENACVRLVQYILPPNLGKRFELVDVSDGKIGGELVLHLYLDERDLPPKNQWVRGRFSDPFVTLASNKRIKMNATTWIKIFQKSGSENRPLI